MLHAPEPHGKDSVNSITITIIISIIVVIANAVCLTSFLVTRLQTNDLEANALAPLQAWIKEYRTFKEKLSLLDNKRLEFDHERRAHNKLELKSVRSKQANDRVEPELAGKIESKGGDVAGNLPACPQCILC